MSSKVTLSAGPHASPQDGRCAMEWVSYLAGEPHSDEPACVSRTLREFCTTLNDGLDDAQRQHLVPFLARTIGTARDGLDEARAWTALDWLVRDYAPAWLKAAGLSEAADRLTQRRAVLDASDLRPAVDALIEARAEMRASAVASVGRWRAGYEAAPVGVGRRASWSSSGAVAWAAARVAVRESLAVDACAAAFQIAGYASAVIVAEAKRGSRRGAGREAAALRPVIAQLEQGTLTLLDRMLPGEGQRPAVPADAASADSAARADSAASARTAASGPRLVHVA